MARRKKRVSNYLALTCLVLIGGGAYASDWRPILAGAGGLGLMLCAWLAFRMTVDCDVKNKTRSGYCTHKVNGLLFGCGDHHWHKVLAWSRYLGAGLIARWLHLHNFPILRFQATRQAEPALVPAGAATSPTETVSVEGGAAAADRQQVLLFYVTAISCAATVVGAVATIVGVVRAP
jgi:hypothetical protein